MKKIFILMILTLSVAVSSAHAQVWISPTQAPPDGNTLAPLNTGSTQQDKAGALRVTGFRSFADAIFDTGVQVSGDLTFLGAIIKDLKGAGIKLSHPFAGDLTLSTVSQPNSLVIRNAGNTGKIGVGGGTTVSGYVQPAMTFGVEYNTNTFNIGDNSLGVENPRGYYRGINMTWREMFNANFGGWILGSANTDPTTSQLVNRSTNAQAIQLGGADDATSGIMFYTNTGIYFQPASGISYFTPTERMRLSGEGNLGIATQSPSQKLEVNGGIRLNTATAKPSCISTARGTFWYTQGASGVKDTVEICAKDAANNYDWRLLY